MGHFAAVCWSKSLSEVNSSGGGSASNDTLGEKAILSSLNLGLNMF